MVHQIGVKLRGRIHGFSRRLYAGMGKTAPRFVEEMIYGIQARGSVRLSEIAWSLAEKASLNKRIHLLSRNLARSGQAYDFGQAELAHGGPLMEEDMLFDR